MHPRVRPVTRCSLDSLSLQVTLQLQGESYSKGSTRVKLQIPLQGFQISEPGTSAVRQFTSLANLLLGEAFGLNLPRSCWVPTLPQHPLPLFGNPVSTVAWKTHGLGSQRVLPLVPPNRIPLSHFIEAFTTTCFRRLEPRPGPQ